MKNCLRAVFLLVRAGFTAAKVRSGICVRRKQAETVVLLSQQNPDDRIRVKVDLDELDETSAEAKATYKKITDWVSVNGHDIIMIDQI